MRPIHLEFSGLRSYRGHAEIDFSSYDLFAIIGDTGAGKSTIIEALSLALYAKKTWSGGAAMSDLIADGQNTMTICLRFASGGEEWEVTRTRHRNTSAPVDRLVGLTTGEHVDNATPVTNRIREIVGLTHEQFTRAVVMPQGRFDELLTAKPTERNKILRSIFGLDDLERVRELAHGLRASWSETLAVHADRRRALPADPAAELGVARERLVLAGNAVSDFAAASAAAEVAEGHLAHREHLERLAAALSAVPTDTASVVAELERVRRRGEALRGECAEVEATKSSAAGEISRLSTRQTELLAGFADRDAAVKITSDLRAAVPVLARARRQRHELHEGEASLGLPTDAAAVLAPADLAVEQAETALRAAVAQRDQSHRHAQAVAEAQHRLADLAAAVAAAQAELAKSEQVQQDAEAGRVAAVDSLAWADDELNQRQGEADGLKQRHVAADLAHGHEPGDTCPVCQRLLDDDFEPPKVPDLDEAVQRAQRARQHELDARRSVTEAEAAAKAAVHASTNATAAHERAAKAHRRQQSSLAALGAPAVEPAEAAVEQAESERRAAVDERSQRAAALEHDENTRREQIASIQTRRAAVDDDLKMVSSVIDALPAAWADPIDPDEPTVESLEAATSSIDQVLAESAEADRLLVAARASQHAADLRLGAIETAAANEVTAPAAQGLSRVSEHVGAVGAVRGLIVDVDRTASVPELPELPEVASGVKTSALADTVASVESALMCCDEIFVTGTGVVEARVGELAGWEARLAEVLSSAEVVTVAELRTVVAEARSHVGVLEREVRDAEARTESAVAADAVLAVAGPTVANLAVVEEALRDRAGRFIDHLVGARERELLAEASRRLKTISSGRHGFVADFGVANIASGEVRPPDALSGGERFQAALALALALVEIASRGGGQLDAVFVDEGFGSLDAAALDAALETLGGVAGGGKMVGLISHLRPVAEYVDTVLHVTKDDTEGSRIRPLDPEAREQLLDAEVRSGLTE